MKKIFLFLLCVIFFVVALYYGRSKPTKAAEEAKPAATAKVQRGPISLIVSTTGRVVSNLDVEIKCKASGQVISLPVDVSDAVKKNDLLVEIDPIDMQRNLKQAQVQLSAARARLAEATQNLIIAERNLITDTQRAQAALTSAQVKEKDANAKAKRMQELLDKKLASPEDYDTATTASVQAAFDLRNAQIKLDELKVEEMQLNLKREDVKLAESEVQLDEISLEINNQRLIETEVRSFIDGVVSTRTVAIGQIISSGITNVGGGTAVMTISDLSHIFVLASVDESDIGKVKVGQPAVITADAYSGVRFEGKVIRIATKGVNSSNVVTFEVKIEVVSENKSLLKPEMTTNIDIVAEKKNDALLLPSEAVTLKQGKHFVSLVKAEGNPEEREVVVGINNDMNLEIVKGVSEGDAVAIQKTEPVSRWNTNQPIPPRMQQRMMMGGMRRP